jgi:site-specific DNA-methyltransferase (adenine-specific)
MNTNTVIHGDCVAVLKTLPAASVDLVVTDPPYLVRYKDRSGRSIKNDDNPDVIHAAFAEQYRVLKPDTFCVSFYGWNHIDTFFRAWTDAGFRAVGHLVWHKGYSSRVGFVKARHEQAYLLVKGQPAMPAEPLDDVRPWEYTGNRCHPTEKAVSVLQPLVEVFSSPDGLVLDPFSGSGSTLIAAAFAGRRYIGIELEAEYCDVARRRLAGVERFRERRKAA